MTETVTPSAPAIEAVQDRLAKLERSVKHLRRKVRHIQNDAVSDIELTPEIKALLDERLKEAEENPGNTIPWDVVRAELQQRYGIK